MPSYSPVSALDWRALIDEAIRRRKAEKMTQRQHAALANVSIPTIVAFDRGEETLTLAKAFDILRVVGLVNQPPGGGDAQDNFVREALQRWRTLTAPLPGDSPGRFPDGHYRIDYALEGELKPVELHRLPDIVERAMLKHTGWPMFLVPRRPDIPVEEIDGTVECWLRPGDSGIDRPVGAAHCDFWRAAPTGRMFLMRGFQEDGQETFPPRTILDPTLIVWRLGEGLLHAVSLTREIGSNGPVNVRFRAVYTGIAGRTLRSWANPLSGFFIEGTPARSDEAVLETTASVSDIEANLADHLLPMVRSLLERFGVSGVSLAGLEGEVERFRNSRAR